MNDLYFKKRVDDIIEILNKIQKGKITVLTGSNGSGKSLIRQLLSNKLNCKVASVSMQSRTSVNNWGIQRICLSDTDWLATSDNSLHLIEQILKVNDRYIVLDEPEIGMGIDLQLGLSDYLNKNLKKVLKNNHGIIIISHSREFISNVKHDEFFNLDNLSYDEWMYNKIEKRSIEEFKKFNDGMYKEINKRLKK